MEPPMSSEQKPSYDLTVPLLILVLIVHFAVIIPGVRMLRAKYSETPSKSHWQPLESE
jgi:hypothetical protein